MGLPPLHHPVLYPRWLTCQASPKAISGRTSYLQPRLAFHPYPQVIQWLFNAKGFGPPLVFLRGSPCPGVDRLVSGLLWLPNTPYSDSVSLRLPTPLITVVVKLGSHNNSPDHSSTGTPSPLIPIKNRNQPGLGQLVGVQFQVLFHSPSGVLFTFPSRYLYAIGQR